MRSFKIICKNGDIFYAMMQQNDYQTAAEVNDFFRFTMELDDPFYYVSRSPDESNYYILRKDSIHYIELLPEDPNERPINPRESASIQNAE